MKKIIKRKGVVILIAVFVLTSLFTIFNNQSVASQLSSVSDTLSRLKISTAANHDIRFATPTGVDAPTDTVTITFPAGFNLGTIAFGDMDLNVDAACDGVYEISKTLAAAPGLSPIWGAVAAGQIVTLTAPTDAAAGEIVAASCVQILIGTNATGGVSQITNPASIGSHVVHIGGTFGDSSNIAVAIVTNDQIGIGANVNAPTGGGAPGTGATPPIVSNIRVVNILQTSASVLWDTNEPATSRVNYGLSDSYGSTETGDGGGLVTSHRVDLSGLTADSIYHFQIVTADAEGATTTTADDIFQTLSGSDITAPIISDIQVINITETGATIIWTTDEPANSKVEYGLTDSYELGEVSSTDFATSHSLVISGLLGNTTYHFRVTSADSSGNAAVSGDDTFTTLAPPDSDPPIISNIRVINITETSATVTWETNERSTSRVRYGLTGAYTTGNIFSADLVTTHSINLISLTRSTLYHFEVSSSDGSGNTATSGDQIFTTLPDAVPPANVTDFTAVPTADLTILLNWVNPTDPDFGGVLIKRSFTTYPTNPAEGEIVFDGVATSFEDTGITSANYNQPIYYTAFAYDAAGNFASGAMAEATISVEITLDIKAWPEKRWPRSGNWSTIGLVDLREPITGTIADEGSVTTSSLGQGAVQFTSISGGNYDIGFKGLSHLRKILRDIPLSNGVNSVDFTLGNIFYLLAGDVHRSSDNMVNALDISTLLGALSTGNEVTDLNRDTGVNSLDINILLANLMRVGDN
ncbi:MAG: fibronectin type III domain-containing protein [Patescibacteria group bacterium]